MPRSMEEMNKAVLVFIPAPGVGHLVSAVEVANLLISRNDHLSIVVLIMTRPFDTNFISYKKSLTESSNSRIKYIDLQQEESSSQGTSPSLFIYEFIDRHKAHTRHILAEISKSATSKLAGIVVDMFCTSMMDVADEFGTPSYVFYASGAAMLGLVLHLQSLRDDFNEDVTDYKDSDVEIAVPTYINAVPSKVLPSMIFNKEGGCTMFLNQAKKYREAKGIIVNTFHDLEPHALEALHNDRTIPPVYAIGPLLNLKGGIIQNQEAAEIIMKWLDLQPDSSVVFLCFGSAGSFDGDQVKEIAYALERSGHRFLWSLRRSPPKGKNEYPSDYENLEEALPEGFLQRTADIGKVIGWAPQAAILSHPAVGGFVSHCGWNSILESVWCGVPVATLPLYAEQQMNAFLMLKDLGMAVEIKMDYRRHIRSTEKDSQDVSADVIEKGIRHLMDLESEVRNKVKEMKVNSELVLMDGGSSSSSLTCFIDDVIGNVL